MGFSVSVGNCGSGCSNEHRRDFIVLAAKSMAALGTVSFAFPLISSIGPSKDVLAAATTEVNLENIKEGQNIKVKWRGKPVFVRHRTDQEIAEMRAISISSLPDPEADSDRVVHGMDKWLVVIGVCTHLGCIPIDNPRSKGGGWFCPCHGSKYDYSGRIVAGPAPSNLIVPDYHFPSKNLLVIGKKA